MVLMACSTTKNLTQESRIHRAISTEKLLDQVKETQADFEWAFIKSSCEAVVGGKKQSFNSTLKWRMDSAMWMSISPALGIEVFRVLMDTQQVQVLDKINKKYIPTNYVEVGEKMKTTLNFQMLQNVLLGKPLFLNDDEKWKVKTDAESYLLLNADAKKWLRRNPNKDLKEGKIDGWVKQYTFNDQFLLTQTEVYDVDTDRNLSIKYKDHQLVDKQYIPHTINIVIQDSIETINFDLDVSRVRLNEPQKLTFKVSGKYEEESF